MSTDPAPAPTVSPAPDPPPTRDAAGPTVRARHGRPDMRARHGRPGMRARHGEPSPRVRRLAFFTSRPSAWSLLVPAVTVLAGVLFATSGSAAEGRNLRTSASGAVDLIREGNRANAADVRRVDELQAEVVRLTDARSRSDARVADLRAKGDLLEPAAGLRAVSGPVIEVSLNDSPLKAADIPPGFTVDDVIVHQQDVQAVVNALWAGGAEAMMLMDQRVISTSAVRCVGNTLILKGRVYSPPFVVRAMGDTAAMRARLDADPTVRIYREYVARLGLGYQVRTEAMATFPAYSGSITPQFATALR